MCQIDADFCWLRCAAVVISMAHRWLQSSPTVVLVEPCDRNAHRGAFQPLKFLQKLRPPAVRIVPGKGGGSTGGEEGLAASLQIIAEFPQAQRLYVMFLEAADSHRLNSSLIRCGPRLGSGSPLSQLCQVQPGLWFIKVRLTTVSHRPQFPFCDLNMCLRWLWGISNC
jgi:hypothetical protein